MKLSAIKNAATALDLVQFKLSNGMQLPVHLHLTEVAGIEKNFIDCGGTVRNEYKVSLQLWHSDNDPDHRLTGEKFNSIIEKSVTTLDLKDGEVEVEFGFNGIEIFTIDFDGKQFILSPKQTACLAEDYCGIPQLETENNATSCCSPSSGCC